MSLNLTVKLLFLHWTITTTPKAVQALNTLAGNNRVSFSDGFLQTKALRETKEPMSWLIKVSLRQLRLILPLKPANIQGNLENGNYREDQ